MTDSGLAAIEDRLALVWVQAGLVWSATLAAAARVVFGRITLTWWEDLVWFGTVALLQLFLVSQWHRTRIWRGLYEQQKCLTARERKISRQWRELYEGRSGPPS